MSYEEERFAFEKGIMEEDDSEGINEGNEFEEFKELTNQRFEVLEMKIDENNQKIDQVLEMLTTFMDSKDATLKNVKFTKKSEKDLREDSDSEEFSFKATGISPKKKSDVSKILFAGLPKTPRATGNNSRRESIFQAKPPVEKKAKGKINSTEGSEDKPIIQYFQENQKYEGPKLSSLASISNVVAFFAKFIAYKSNTVAPERVQKHIAEELTSDLIDFYSELSEYRINTEKAQMKWAVMTFDAVMTLVQTKLIPTSRMAFLSILKDECLFPEREYFAKLERAGKQIKIGVYYFTQFYKSYREYQYKFMHMYNFLAAHCDEANIPEVTTGGENSLLSRFTKSVPQDIVKTLWNLVPHEERKACKTINAVIEIINDRIKDMYQQHRLALTSTEILTNKTQKEMYEENKKKQQLPAVSSNINKYDDVEIEDFQSQFRSSPLHAMENIVSGENPMHAYGYNDRKIPDKISPVGAKQILKKNVEPESNGYCIVQVTNPDGCKKIDCKWSHKDEDSIKGCIDGLRKNMESRFMLEHNLVCGNCSKNITLKDQQGKPVQLNLRGPYKPDRRKDSKYTPGGMHIMDEEPSSTERKESETISNTDY